MTYNVKSKPEVFFAILFTLRIFYLKLKPFREAPSFFFSLRLHREDLEPKANVCFLELVNRQETVLEAQHIR